MWKTLCIEIGSSEPRRVFHSSREISCDVILDSDNWGDAILDSDWLPRAEGSPVLDSDWLPSRVGSMYKDWQCMY